MYTLIGTTQFSGTHRGRDTVLRDLFVLKGDKELSFGERKMLDTARNLLVKELSIARSHPEEKIMEELSDIFAH